MNPKHQVPIFDHDGQIVTESRGIAKYFHENFNQDLEKNDHWYPKDPEERAKVRFITFFSISLLSSQVVRCFLLITWFQQFPISN